MTKTDIFKVPVPNNMVLPIEESLLPPSPENIPNKSNISQWSRDLISEGLGLVPYLGNVLKKISEPIFQTGQYSDSNRLATMQLSWLVQEIPNLAKKLESLKDEIPESEYPTPDDIAAVVIAAQKVSQKTADYKKRKILRQTLLNSFDKDLYQQGLSIRFFKIMENLEYGDMRILHLCSKEKHSEIKKHPPDTLARHHLVVLEEKGLISTWNISDGLKLPVTNSGFYKATALGIALANFIRIEITDDELKRKK